MDPLHVLLAIALELPEDYFTSRHKYEDKSEDHIRYMKYNKYTPEEYANLGELIVRGHTDLGSWTLLFRQPVAGLQIKDYSSGSGSNPRMRPSLSTLVTLSTCSPLTISRAPSIGLRFLQKTRSTLIVLVSCTSPAHTTTLSYPPSPNHPSFGVRGSHKTNSRRPATLSQLWKV